jgi:hypothetical protein
MVALKHFNFDRVFLVWSAGRLNLITRSDLATMPLTRRVKLSESGL